MMLQAVVEPIVFRLKPDQNAGRTTMTGDHDLFISSPAARRRYFDRASLISGRATARRPCAFFVKPSLRFVLPDDGEDLDRRFRNVIEHPDVADPQPDYISPASWPVVPTPVQLEFGRTPAPWRD
jgi:hypothetical protein